MVAGSWLASEHVLARRVGRPVAGFVRLPAAAGAVLALGVVAGLVWASSPWRSSYGSFWSTEVVIQVGPVSFAESLRATIDDAAMVLFFFAIGLEVKRELVAGSLRHPRAVALPVAAAVGGMVVPAVLFVLLTAGTPSLHGWAIPMATDTALALGVARLSGPLLPRRLIVFLLSLAIVDDIAVVVVIATFYTDRIHLAWLAAALGAIGLVVLLQRAKVWHVPVYVAVGIGVWYFVFRSGVHATMAGVVLGLLTPARPLRPSLVPAPARTVGGDAFRIRQAGFVLREQVSVAERLHHLIEPWVGFVILPLFAVANAGIAVSGAALAHALSSRVALAVLVARVVGKPVGIVGAAWLAYRVGIAHLPSELRWAQIGWTGVLGAVGFTVSVYVSTLAFAGAQNTDATLAVMVTTLLAGTAALAGMRRTHRLHAAPLRRRPGPGPAALAAARSDPVGASSARGCAAARLRGARSPRGPRRSRRRAPRGGDGRRRRQGRRGGSRPCPPRCGRAPPDERRTRRPCRPAWRGRSRRWPLGEAAGRRGSP